jgi:outer membrane protein insertion porin family
LGLFGGVYTAETVEYDVRSLIQYYQGFGFLDVKVSAERRWNGDGHTVNLTYHIQEGPRYRLGNPPQVVGSKVIPTKQLEALVEVERDDVYDRTKIEADIERLKDCYGDTGRLAEVRHNVIFSNDTAGVVQLQYEVCDEGRPLRVGQIIIEGNKKTRCSTILDQVPFHEGEILRRRDLRTVEANLAGLGRFVVDPVYHVRPLVCIMVDGEHPDCEYRDVRIWVMEDDSTPDDDILIPYPYNCEKH